MRPPPRPRAIDAANMAIANGHPNRPAVYIMPSGEVSGEATMKATMGAQGMVLAIIPRTTAVVPHEQKGVPTAAAVAMTTPGSAVSRKERGESPRVDDMLQGDRDRHAGQKVRPVVEEREHHLFKGPFEQASEGIHDRPPSCECRSSTQTRVRRKGRRIPRIFRGAISSAGPVVIVEERSSPWHGRIALVAALVVIDDPAPLVELEVAAFEEELPQLLGALDTRFRPRQRDACPLGEVFLAQALVLGCDERLAVRGGKLIDGFSEREGEPGPWILLEGEVLSGGDGPGELLDRPAAPVVIDDKVPGDPVDPALQVPDRLTAAQPGESAGRPPAGCPPLRSRRKPCRG